MDSKRLNGRCGRRNGTVGRCRRTKDSLFYRAPRIAGRHEWNVSRWTETYRNRRKCVIRWALWRGNRQLIHKRKAKDVTCHVHCTWTRTRMRPRGLNFRSRSTEKFIFESGGERRVRWEFCLLVLEETAALRTQVANFSGAPFAQCVYVRVVCVTLNWWCSLILGWSLIVILPACNQS